MTDNWTAPTREVFERLRRCLEDGREAALATVVDVDGRAYRRPGAKMVVEPENRTGSVTAGCLEHEVQTVATTAIETGTPRVETWDLTTEEWGMGVGCDGVVSVLVEPLTETHRPVADAWWAGERVGVVTVVGGDLPLGTRGFYDPETRFDGALPAWVREPAAETVGRVLEAGDVDTRRSTVEDGDRTVDLFVESVDPPPELVVFGGGDDVGPVVELAATVDFRVTVVTFRGGQADPERFPAADATVAASPRDVGTLGPWNEDTYAVVMSHNFVDDRLAVAELLDTPVPYIGLMGPRTRFERMCEAFTDAGWPLTERDHERLYAPVGLDLGAETPHQVAYSIVAELLAVANGRTPQHLHRHEGPIHDRADSG
jgi:xanthine dehydrogenase accessory factor